MTTILLGLPGAVADHREDFPELSRVKLQVASCNKAAFMGALHRSAVLQDADNCHFAYVNGEYG